MLVAAESSIQREVSQDEGVVLHGLLLLLEGKLFLTSVDDTDVPDDQYEHRKSIKTTTMPKSSFCRLIGGIGYNLTCTTSC